MDGVIRVERQVQYNEGKKYDWHIFDTLDVW